MTSDPRLTPDARRWLPLLRATVSTIRAKLILPYLVLTLIVAVVGTLIATRLATTDARERFYNQLAEASRVASDSLVRQEREHLENLRFLVFSAGVAEAVVAGDSAALKTRLLPIMLTKNIESVSVLNAAGRDVLTLAYDASTDQYRETSGTDLSGFPPVARVLEGREDEAGDKYAGILNTQLGYYLLSTAPIRRGDELVGVMIIGTSLKTVVAALKAQALADVVVLDLAGQFVATSLAEPDEGFGVLALAPDTLPAAEGTTPVSRQLYGRPYEGLYAPLTLRGEVAGFLGSFFPSEYIFDVQALSRDTISVIFTTFAIAIIILGFMLAQLIVRPLLRLRAVTQAVAAGDLEQTTGLKQADEIGDLAGTFDTMTERLRERTRVAAQLYQETLQRNKELAAANTQLKAAQQQLVHSEKMAAIGQLTAGIVHDVKNPLAGAMGLAELMTDDPAMDDVNRQNLNIIIENIKRANRIVGDLMKFARQSSLERQLGDLRTTAETVARLTGYMARQARVELRLDLPSDGVLATYDQQLIEQVLINLVQNAIQAMPKGGPLELKVRQVEDMVAVAVADSGTGIPAEHLGRIFDPFFTTKPAGVGTGLGLSVSYGIVSNHGGRIDVESTLGRGTTFTVWLPIHPPVAKLDSPRPMTGLPARLN